MKHEILETRNYSMFKNVSFNREKSRSHIEKLKKEIINCNLLEFHPILINDDMEVVDGQHRLAAAEELGLPVFYMKGKIPYNHILNTNMLHRSIKLSDIIKYYAEGERLPNYVRLKKMALETGLSYKSILGVIFGGVGKTTINFLKSGRFEFPDDNSQTSIQLADYIQFFDYMRSKRFTPLSTLKSSFCTIAFRQVHMLPGFEFNIFKHKLEERWHLVKPQANTEEWKKLFLSIFNYRNQNPLVADYD